MIHLNIHDAVRLLDGLVLKEGPDLDIQKIVIHSGDASQGAFFVVLLGSKNDGHEFIRHAVSLGASGIIGIKEKLDQIVYDLSDFNGWLIGVDDTLKALGKLAFLVLRKSKAKKIAITGSSGKTTTKEMIAHVLQSNFRVHKTKGNFNNFLGLPLSVFEINEDDDVSVLELGMNAPGEIRWLASIVEPDIGVLTNVQPAHLQYLRTIERVRDAKAELLTGLDSKSSALVTNLDDQNAKRVADAFGGRKFFVSKSKKADLYVDGDIVWNGYTTKALIKSFEQKNAGVMLKFPYPGSHFVSDILLALGVGMILGVSLESGVSSLKSFTFPSMRFEKTILPQGALVVFDGYNANPSSMRASLEAFMLLASDKEKVMVIGDMLELGIDAKFYHKELGGFLARVGCEVFVIGEFAKDVCLGALQVSDCPNMHVFDLNQKNALALSLSLILSKNHALFIKGSRDSHLEDILYRLRAHLTET